MEFKLFISTLVENNGKILLVKESKKENYGKWNLPGGHLELGEKLIDGAIRETKEETNIIVEITSFLGCYILIKNNHSFRFVFCSSTQSEESQPASDILECKWWRKEDFEKLTDEEIVSPEIFRDIFRDYFSGKRFPFEGVVEKVVAQK